MRQVPCPTCGKPSPFSRDNRWRPFCSERCKMIDLGDWADERYRVKGSEQTSPESPESDEEK